MSTYLDELNSIHSESIYPCATPCATPSGLAEIRLKVACSTVDALRDENARLKGQIEKARDMGAENYRAANGYMELLDREKVVSELLRTDLTTLRSRIAALERDGERLDAVIKAALHQVAFEVSAIPESHLENGRIEHNGILLIHRILANRNPEGKFTGESVNECDAARQADAAKEAYEPETPTPAAEKHMSEPSRPIIRWHGGKWMAAPEPFRK